MLSTKVPELEVKCPSPTSTPSFHILRQRFATPTPKQNVHQIWLKTKVKKRAKIILEHTFKY